MFCSVLFYEMKEDTNYYENSFLMTALTVLLVLIGDYFGGLQGMIVMLSFSVIMNFYAYWNSDKMVLRHYNAREVDAQSAPALYKMVQELARRGNLPMPKVYIIDSPVPNAFCYRPQPGTRCGCRNNGAV